MVSLGTATVAPGESVGLFDVAGASVTNARIYLKSANSGPFRISVGEEEFRLPEDSIVTSEEITLKNTDSVAQTISVLVIPQAVGGGGSGVNIPEGEEGQVLSFDEAGALIARGLVSSDVVPDGTSTGQVLKWGASGWAPGTDTNTTYTAMTAAEAEAGTSTASRSITPAVLAAEIDRRVAAALASYTPPAGE